MAYVSKEKKQKIVVAAKKIIPADWKVTFSVRHHSTIIATISQVPASVQNDFIVSEHNSDPAKPNVNVFYLEKSFKGKTLEKLRDLLEALNTDNFDNSDIMTDYFHVGHHVEIQFGKWNKPAIFI